jgi:hypothetical protein
MPHSTPTVPIFLSVYLRSLDDFTVPGTRQNETLEILQERVENFERMS